MKPIISVIVNCFNRRDYVIDALKSACDQNLSRSEYEIILIKNFHEVGIDKFTKENGIINIYTDKVTTGSWFEIAANNSKGDFISFLDDDDIMSPNKLYVIKSIIQQYPKIGYIHNKSTITNTVLPVTEFDNSKIVFIQSYNRYYFRRALKHKYYSNLSSISIRRNLLINHMHFIIGTSHGTDFVIFAAACMSGSMMIEYDERLTFFRIHTDSQSNFVAGSITEFESMKGKVLSSFINNWFILSEFENESPMKQYAKLRLVTTRIWLNLVSSNHVYNIGCAEIIASIRGISLYPIFIPFIFIYYFDRLFHRATKKIYYMVIYSRIGWRLRENI